MSSLPRPILCTLTPSELDDRGAAWAKVLGSGLVERIPIPGGIRLVAAPGAIEALTALIGLERECCAWIDYQAVGTSTFLLTAAGEGAEVLNGMFLPDATGRVLT